MEYILLLEKSKRYKILIGFIVFFFVFILMSSMFLGLKGFALSTGLLFFGLLTPLLAGNNKFFLFLWIVIYPVSTIFMEKMFLAGDKINPFTFLITGISFPYAIILFSGYIGMGVKKLPYLWGILLLEFTVLLNLIRPEIIVFNVVQWFNFHFMTIFVIMITYFYVKKNPPDLIFKWMSFFGVANAVVAVFQGITGIGKTDVMGIMRTAGLTGFPNACGFLINVYSTVVLYKFIKAETKKQKIIWGLNLLINMLALLLTLSKTSFAIFGILLLIIFLNLSSKHRFKFLLFTFLSVLAFIFLDNILHMDIISNLNARFGEMDSLAWRFKVWGWLLGNLNFITFFIGNGIGSVYRYLLTINPGESPLSHNGYIELLYEYGILGLTYVLGLIYIFINSVKKLIREADFNKKIDFMVPVMVSSVILTELCFDQVFMNKISLYFAWIILTIFWSQNMNIEKDNTKHSGLQDNKL